MATKVSTGHQGRPTEASLASFLDDPTSLLQCSDCGAWVDFDVHHIDSTLLEVHADRRPKVHRNRMLQPYKRTAVKR